MLERESLIQCAIYSLVQEANTVIKQPTVRLASMETTWSTQHCGTIAVSRGYWCVSIQSHTVQRILGSLYYLRALKSA